MRPAADMLHCGTTGPGRTPGNGYRIRLQPSGPHRHPKVHSRPQVTTMIRPLLVLSLSLLAANALAVEAVEADRENAGCPKAEAAASKDPSADGKSPPARPGNTAPVRPRTGTTRGAPRWHSLLPGMFR